MEGDSRLVGLVNYKVRGLAEETPSRSSSAGVMITDEDLENVRDLEKMKQIPALWDEVHERLLEVMDGVLDLRARLELLLRAAEILRGFMDICRGPPGILGDQPCPEFLQPVQEGGALLFSVKDSGKAVELVGAMVELLAGYRQSSCEGNYVDTMMGTLGLVASGLAGESGGAGGGGELAEELDEVEVLKKFQQNKSRKEIRQAFQELEKAAGKGPRFRELDGTV